MAFKMKGFPKHMHGSPMKTGHDKLLPSENPDTEITGGNIYEEIIDLEDRIEFIKEDIFQQDGKATEQQKKDIATLQAKLKELRAKK
jgi:hypothetical protein